MKRLLVILVLLLKTALLLQGQDNMSVLYHGQASTQASFILPSKLGIDHKNTTLILPILPNVYSFVGNNFLSYRNTYNIWKGGSGGAEAIEASMQKLHKRNSVATGFDYDFFHLYFKIGKGKKEEKQEKISLDFFTRARTRGHFFFSDDFAHLIWYGNHPYAGKTVNMNPMGFFAQSWLEYGTGAAFNVLEKDKLKIRIGVKVRYLQGIACVKTDIEKFDVTTEQDGKYIEASTRYTLYTSNIENFNGSLRPQGNGWAGDIGATAFIGKGFEVSLGVTDLGYIHYKKNVLTFSCDTSFRYEGIELKNSDNGFSLDTLQRIFDPVKTEGGHFTSMLGAKITLQGAYKLGFKTTDKGREFAAHTFYFTYVQGLQNVAGSITHPYFSGAYNYNAGQHLCVGGFINYGGFYHGCLGLYTSIEFGFFRWGFSISNLAPYIIQSTSLNAEVSTNMSFAF